MATAFRVIDERHATRTAGPGPLARLATSLWRGLKHLHERRHAEMDQLPVEYWFWSC